MLVDGCVAVTTANDDNNIKNNDDDDDDDSDDGDDEGDEGDLLATSGNRFHALPATPSTVSMRCLLRIRTNPALALQPLQFHTRVRRHPRRLLSCFKGR
jgi:hypothetical protein